MAEDRICCCCGMLFTEIYLCPFCGAEDIPRCCLVCDDAWWDDHCTWGVRRCGEPTPEHLKRVCPHCKGNPKEELGIWYCSCCDNKFKVNQNDH